MLRRKAGLFWAIAILVGFGFSMMGCATTEQLKAVDDKVTAAGAKADKALSEAQAAKSQATGAASKAEAAAKKAADAQARAEAAGSKAAASAKAADECAKKCEAIFMKKLKK